jgi:hypothetical protein
MQNVVYKKKRTKKRKKKQRSKKTKNNLLRWRRTQKVWYNHHIQIEYL